MLFKDFFERHLLAIACFSIIAFLSFFVFDGLPFSSKKIVSSDTQSIEQPSVTHRVTNPKTRETQIEHSHPELAKLLQTTFGETQLAQLREFLLMSKLEDMESVAIFISQAKLPKEQTTALTLATINHWSALAPEQALTHAYTEPDRSLRRLAVSTVLDRECGASESIKGCIEKLPFANELDEALASMAYKMSGISNRKNQSEYAVTESNPSNAILWANAIQAEALRKNAVSKIAMRWLESEPGRVMEWALSEDEFGEIGITAARVFSESDPWTTLEIASSIPDDNASLRETIYKTIIRAQTDQGEYYSAVSLLDSLPSNEHIESYYEEFIEQWSSSDPQAAVQGLMNLPDSIERDRLAATVLQNWSSQYPNQALDFASGLKAENLRKSAWSAAMESWSREDFHSTLNWVKQQPSSITLDKAISRVSTSLINSNVSAASLAALVNEIDDDDLRQSMMAQIADREGSSLDEAPGE